MMRRLSVPLLLVLAVTSSRAAGPTIAIDASSPSGNVSRLFYGLMTEEINHAYDGGLYAELVRNRAFLDDTAAPAHWATERRPRSPSTPASRSRMPSTAACASTSRRRRKGMRPGWRTKVTGAFP